MKKLKRNELKKIEGGRAEIMSCDIDMLCTKGLCCSTGYICRDPKKYPCSDVKRRLFSVFLLKPFK